MYKACIIDDDSLIRKAVTNLLKENEFVVSEFCEIKARCPAYPAQCLQMNKELPPCRNMLVLFNCERDHQGIDFLKFIERHQCPCVHSFKVLYTCEEFDKAQYVFHDNLHVQFVEKENPSLDLLPVIEQYKVWYRTAG